MMKKIIIFICASFLSLTGRAQVNLVLNPSFEEQTVCPDLYDEAKYAYWTGLDTVWSPPDWAHAVFGVPDYCHVCTSFLGVAVPGDHTGYFYHYPRTGNGMMQVNMFYDETVVTGGPQQFRDYLQGRLSKTLINGNTYIVTFYVSSENASYYSVNHIGAYLDNGTIDTTHNPGWTQTQYTPQIVENAIINDTAASDSTTWIKIEGTFTANGTEKFITIGQFTDQAHTNFFAIKDTTGGQLYSLYLVDDVSVFDCGSAPFAGHDTLISLGDSVFIGSHELLLPYTWYEVGITTPIDSGGGFWAHPTTATTYVLEQNLCGIKKWDTVKVWVAPLSVGSQQLVVGSLMVYPNPVTDEITIEHAANCKVAFYDVTGRKVASFVSMTNKEVLDISTLPSGVYLVQVTDESTGARAVKTLLKE